MGLFDSIAGSGEAQPEDIVAETVSGDYSPTETVDRLQDAINRSESAGDEDVSTCITAHVHLAETLLVYPEETAEAVDGDPLDVTDSHLEHASDLVRKGYGSEGDNAGMLSKIQSLSGQVALERENYGIAIDRSRQALANTDHPEVRLTANRVLGVAHENLGNSDLAEGYMARHHELKQG